MSNILEAHARVGVGKGAARQLRRQGLIPAVCYGSQQDSIHVAVDPKELTKLLKSSPMGRNSVIELTGGRERWHVMVQEIQRDPLKRTPVHIDFRVVKDDDEVVVEVPVRRTGRSKAEELGARVNPVRRSVRVRCQVKDIPEVIEHDVSEMEAGDIVRASDLRLGDGVAVVFKTDFTVLSMLRARGAGTGEESSEAPTAA